MLKTLYREAEMTVLAISDPFHLEDKHSLRKPFSSQTGSHGHLWLQIRLYELGEEKLSTLTETDNNPLCVLGTLTPKTNWIQVRTKKMEMSIKLATHSLLPKATASYESTRSKGCSCFFFFFWPIFMNT